MASFGAWILLLILAAGTCLLMFLLHRTRLGPLIHERIPDRPRRRLLLASVSFFLTFACVRGMVFCITHDIPPFHFILIKGRHIHHLVFGILILLAVGYGWLCDLGTGMGETSILASRLMSILYGFYEADRGEIRVNGEPVRIRSSREAISHGIGMVHQHFMLVPPLSVLENVMLGAEGGLLLSGGAGAIRKRLGELGREYGLVVDPDAIVHHLNTRRGVIFHRYFNGAFTGRKSVFEAVGDDLGDRDAENGRGVQIDIVVARASCPYVPDVARSTSRRTAHSIGSSVGIASVTFPPAVFIKVSLTMRV